VFKPTRDLRVESLRPLLPPAILLEELPLSEQASMTVSRGREEVARILNGQDDRLVVVVGPCSIHDPGAALDYGRRLRALADEVGEALLAAGLLAEKPSVGQRHVFLNTRRARDIRDLIEQGETPPDLRLPAS